MLLDLRLPGSDGMELMKDILAIDDVPVIFLSVYGQDEVVARAFDMGAADYVVKPFSPTELSARIRAALRRRMAPEPLEPYVMGDLTIDYAQRSVTVAGHMVELTAISAPGWLPHGEAGDAERGNACKSVSRRIDMDR